MTTTILCVGDDPSRLLLYRSLLELEGYSVLVGESAEEGFELSKHGIADCAVLDHAEQGAVLAREIGRTQPKLPIVFVLDTPELPVEIYPEVEMFIAREEAIEELTRCIREVLNRSHPEHANVNKVEELELRRSAAPLHRLLVSWILPW